MSKLRCKSRLSIIGKWVGGNTFVRPICTSFLHNKVNDTECTYVLKFSFEKTQIVLAIFFNAVHRVQWHCLVWENHPCSLWLFPRSFLVVYGLAIIACRWRPLRLLWSTSSSTTSTTACRATPLPTTPAPASATTIAATAAAACTTATTSTSLSTAAWRVACAVAVLSFFIGVLVHRGAVLWAHIGTK